MKRALRVDKLTLAALAEVLKLYAQPGDLMTRIPALRWLTRPADEVRQLADRMLPVLTELLPAWPVAVVQMPSQVGSGALPTREIPSWGLKVGPRRSDNDIEALATFFRRLDRPVLGRIQEQALWLDCRCIDDVDTFCSQLSGLSGPG